MHLLVVIISKLPSQADLSGVGEVQELPLVEYFLVTKTCTKYSMCVKMQITIQGRNYYILSTSKAQDDQETQQVMTYPRPHCFANNRDHHLHRVPFQNWSVVAGKVS